MGEIPGRWTVSDQWGIKTARVDRPTSRAPRQPREAHTHICIDQQREDPGAVAGLEPANRTKIRKQRYPEWYPDDAEGCRMKAGDRYVVAGSSSDGFALRRHTSEADQSDAASRNCGA